MSAVNSSKSTKIKTAVEFLGDVHNKGYSEVILRKYLIEKRGLSAQDVDVAFLINKNRIEAAAKQKQGKQINKIWNGLRNRLLFQPETNIRTSPSYCQVNRLRGLN